MKRQMHFNKWGFPQEQKVDLTLKHKKNKPSY